MLVCGLTAINEAQSGGGPGEKSFEMGVILDAKGNPIEILQEPLVGIGVGLAGWEPLFAIDVDSDGVDELVCQISHYEGGSRVIYHWGINRLISTTLASDSS